jgi:hypothetical protein
MKTIYLIMFIAVFTSTAALSLSLAVGRFHMAPGRYVGTMEWMIKGSDGKQFGPSLSRVECTITPDYALLIRSFNADWQSVDLSPRPGYVPSALESSLSWESRTKQGREIRATGSDWDGVYSILVTRYRGTEIEDACRLFVAPVPTAKKDGGSSGG